MNNQDFYNINIPNNIDQFIESGVNKAVKERKLKRKRKVKKISGVMAASIISLVILNVANPAFAAKIPIIGAVFENIEKNIYFPANYSQYATKVNEVVSSNGINITLSEILCDGQSLYVTYIVEKDQSFKNTSWGIGKDLDMNQLITEEAYSKVSFSNKELDNTGFAGLEGKFINENTFIGMEKYKLESLGTNIPDEFEFQVKINSIGTNGLKIDDKDDMNSGTWAFKIPVKVDKSLRKEFNINEGNNILNISSISSTPFDMIINVKYLKDNWNNYRVKVYDQSGNELVMENGDASQNGKVYKLYYKSPQQNSKNIRVVVDKPILKEVKDRSYSLDNGGKEIVYEETGSEVVFDKLISLEK